MCARVDCLPSVARRISSELLPARTPISSDGPSTCALSTAACHSTSYSRLSVSSSSVGTLDTLLSNLVFGDQVPLVLLTELEHGDLCDLCQRVGTLVLVDQSDKSPLGKHVRNRVATTLVGVV